MLQGEYSKLSYIVNKPSNPLITRGLLPFTEHWGLWCSWWQTKSVATPCRFF